MKIKHMGMFILGIIDILLGMIIVVIVLFGHKEASKLLAAGICLVCGADMVINNIETKNERLRRKAELKDEFETFGKEQE